MKIIISIVQDEWIVAKVGKTMTAMIYERCTLVTLPFTLLPPSQQMSIQYVTKPQCTALYSTPLKSSNFHSKQHPSWREESPTENVSQTQKVFSRDLELWSLTNDHGKVDKPGPGGQKNHRIKSDRTAVCVSLHCPLSATGEITSIGQVLPSFHLPKKHFTLVNNTKFLEGAWLIETSCGASWWAGQPLKAVNFTSPFPQLISSPLSPN